MKKEILYTLSGMYRDDFRITGYRFGSGEKSCCIVGSMRGDEIQPLYVCGKIVQILTSLEAEGKLAENHEILVVPSMNSYSMNIGRRFWCLDNTDINRHFPGSGDGETTDRVAAAVFGEIKQFKYCVQFPSFYIPGNFVPHVRMMKTEQEEIAIAKNFGLPYIVLRSPTAMDKSTLNFSLQSSGTLAFSVYTRTRETIDDASAELGVSAVLRFLEKTGAITTGTDGGAESRIIDEMSMINVKSASAGICRKTCIAGDHVKRGGVLAEVIHPYEGVKIDEITAPEDGVVFFAHHRPLISEYTLAFKMIAEN